MNVAAKPAKIVTAPFDIFERWLYDGVILFGQTGDIIWRSFLCILQGKIDWAECIRQAYLIGVKSLLVVGLTSLFTGFAMTLQIAKQLVGFGGETFIGGVVTLALIRQIGPICAGVMVAGRVGSSMAAELATMTISEQIDALKVMRIDPVQYLVVPRFLGAMIMMPGLAIYATYIGLFAGIHIAHTAANIAPATFLDSVKTTIIDSDFNVLFIKSLTNAALVIFFSCAIGLNTRGGATDVGLATTRAVVWSMTTIFILNYVITALTYEGPR